MPEIMAKINLSRDCIRMMLNFLGGWGKEKEAIICNFGP